MADLPPWMARARRRAEAEAGEQPELSIGSLDRVLASAPRAASRGLDIWRAAEFARLPPEGKHGLLGLLRDVESELAWPAQLFLVRMAKLAKTGGGHRLVALAGALYRTWSTLRRPGVVSWEQVEKRMAFWDTAVSGSSCLRVALARAIKGEACNTLGASFCQVN